MRTWLKEKRLAKEYTMQELAKLADVSWQSISYYENGERRPTPETAKKIAFILDFPWTWFFEEERKEDGTA